MAKLVSNSILACFLLVGAIQCNSTLKQELLKRALEIQAQVKPVLKFLEQTKSTNQVTQLSTHLTEMNRLYLELVQTSQENVILENQMISSQKVLVTEIRSTILVRAEVLAKKAHDAIGDLSTPP